MGFFEIIGFAACIVGAAVLVAWIFTFFDEWNDIQYRVREGIPKDIAFLDHKINELSSQEDEEDDYEEENDCEEDNIVASLSERVTILEQYVKFLCKNNNIIPMSIPYQADLEKDVVKTSVYPPEEE